MMQLKCILCLLEQQTQKMLLIIIIYHTESVPKHQIVLMKRLVRVSMHFRIIQRNRMICLIFPIQVKNI